MVRRTRQVGEKIGTEDGYYRISLGLSVDAQVFAETVSSHWSVGNALHWSLDIRRPSAQGQCTSELGRRATYRTDPAQAGDNKETGDAKQARTRGIGFRISGDRAQNGTI